MCPLTIGLIMRTLFLLFIVGSVAIGFPMWQAVGPEGIGNGLTGIAQSYSDSLTLYAVGGTVTQGNYLIESQSIGGGWDLFSSPSAKNFLGGVMAITPDEVMLFAKPSQDQIARSTKLWANLELGFHSKRLFNSAGYRYTAGQHEQRLGRREG